MGDSALDNSVSRAAADVPAPPTSSGQGPGRHLVGVISGIGFLAAWILIGFLLGLGVVGFVLLTGPLLAVFQTVVRRRPLNTLLIRDTASFGSHWPGKVLVAVVLIVIPAAMVLASLIVGQYVADSWQALLMLVVLGGSYLVTRRLLLTVLIGAMTVSIVTWVLSPNLASARNGDATVLAHLDHQAELGLLAGLHDVVVADIDLNANPSVRLAGMGADHRTPMEIGSITKAMTGLVIADAAERGEIRMDAPVSTYLPELGGSPAGAVTMQELVTHTSGYAAFGAATLRRAVWKAPLGLNFLDADASQMTQEIREQTLTGRGRFAYSTLGAATAGQAVAAAAHMSYAELMRTRLFEPLGMTHTYIQDPGKLVEAGRSRSGLPVQPWVMNAYAPGGGAVSTTDDLAKLATALLDGTAPGMVALDPTTATDESGSRVGNFWLVSTSESGQTITWHGGETGGYAAYLGLDRLGRKAVIVLADVAIVASNLGTQLLAQRSSPTVSRTVQEY